MRGKMAAMAQTKFGLRNRLTRRLGTRVLAMLAVGGLLAVGSPVSVAAQQDRPFEGEVLTIVGSETSREAVAAIKAALVPFERVSGMVVVYTPSIDAAVQIDLQIAAGAPPDVVMVGDTVAASLIDSGDAIALSDDIREIGEQNFAAAVLDRATVDNVRYGVPVSAMVHSNVWYKPGIFSSNGYGVPLSWAGLRTLANQMISDGNTPFCIGIESGPNTGWVVADWIEDLVLRLAGPETYDAWIANEIPFSDPRIEAAFAQVLDLWSTPAVTRGGLAGIRADSHSVDPAQGLAADECAMVRQRSSLLRVLDTETRSEVDTFLLPGAIGDRSVIASLDWALALTDGAAVDALLDYLGSASYTAIRQTRQQAATGGEGGPSGYLTPNLRVDQSLWHRAEASMNAMLHDPTIIRPDGSDAMPEEVAAAFLAEATAMIEGKDLAEVLATIDEELPEVIVVDEELCEGLEVTIMGTDDDDVITGTLGNDVIDGGAGNDTIAGGGGDDIICGGPGDDTIWGNIGDDLLIGGDGDDKVRGGSGNDDVRGGAGADDLSGSKGDDVVDGGSGDDVAIRGGTGDDRLTGGTGDEVLMNGNGGEDEVYGGSGSDVVNGGPRRDRLFGGEGDDELKGNGGPDLIWGEAGDDTLRGGPQPDSLYGGDDTDDCNGGTEEDSAVDCESSTFTELECMGNYIASSIGCVTPNASCLQPEVELETVAGVPMIDPVTGESVASVTYSCVLVCEPPAEPAEPGRCVLALP